MAVARYTFTPETITNLREDEILVFGSNYAGRHGKGLALQARQQFGAQYGVGRGPTGQCYALPTKDYNMQPLPLAWIDAEIRTMLTSAGKLSTRWFLVTKIGTGLAGYSVAEVGNLFVGKSIPSNVILPVEFVRIMRNNTETKEAY